MILTEHFSAAVPVRVKVSLPTAIISIGTDLLIPYSVEGNPIPSVTWYKDGHLLQDNERTIVTGEREYLTINKITTIDFN